MGQKKGNKDKKSTVATVDDSTRKSTSGVTTLHPAGKAGKSASATPAGPTHEQIAQRAHELWVKNGARHGEDQRHWLEAETELKQEMGIK